MEYRPLDSVVVLSDSYDVDRIYRSMMGPRSREYVALSEGEPELVWVTGFEAVMVSGDGMTPELQDFMCHSNLDFDSERHAVA